jgi:hypothetical protein
MNASISKCSSPFALGGWITTLGGAAVLILATQAQLGEGRGQSGQYDLHCTALAFKLRSAAHVSKSAMCTYCRDP